ncbi:hypothetical protein AVEN_235286-1 [Araneus ventricosus]|uniref:Uncharacterized protein n=1 Tax=Araneus ventricosus TaxID=182803 RepID=A0A4Y2A5T1_ARAVE|nr:hypothetical protein AVEN_235286-1 [Araneus ventricosus]
MGCSPSQSSSAILVEPRRSPSINEMKSSDELPADSQKEEFLKEMIDDADVPNEEFLQDIHSTFGKGMQGLRVNSWIAEESSFPWCPTLSCRW